jgi:hypothetical protein
MRANTMLMNPFPNSYTNDPLAGVRAAKKAARAAAGLGLLSGPKDPDDEDEDEKESEDFVDPGADLDGEKEVDQEAAGAH